MYIPSQFKEDRTEVLHQAIAQAGAATIISMTSDGLYASHAPLFLDPDPAPCGTVVGHLAKANPHNRILVPGTETLVIFHGPGGYITPSYYPTKREHGKVVPTWNYSAIHAYGTLEVFTDPDRLLGVVTRLTNMYEAPRGAPWAVTDAPADFVQGMLKAIYGISLRITRLEGKVKMSQNRPEPDQQGVVKGLTEDGQDALARAVTQALGNRP